MNKKQTKVLLALSGGVDSAVAAALLLDEGYEVVGAFMKNWSDGKSIRGVCNWKEERQDATRVAAHLGIPLVTFDFEKEYREQVVAPMCASYATGSTPNPDVDCNAQVKFPLLWREAQNLGADFIATGHHVQKNGIMNNELGITEWQLLAGKDKNKDQSYFLHQLTQENLAHTLFPIGYYTKEEVRTMARERGIPVADKRSTRGICFIGKVPMPAFLEQAVATKSGLTKTTTGKIIGEHAGVAPFTIGQRHGFGGGGGTPYYVVAKDPKTNTLVVGDEHDPQLYQSEITVTDMHWISNAPELPLECWVRTRYRAPLQKACLYDDNGIIVKFQEPVRAPAPGQSAVCYHGEICLGGGIIS